MSLFVECLRFILCCHTEHFTDSYEYDDTSSREPFRYYGSRNPSAGNSHLVYNSIPRTTITSSLDNDPLLPKSSPSTSSYQARVAVDSWIRNSVRVNPQYVQDSFQRTNEISQNSKSPSSLQPSFSFCRAQSSSKLPPSSSKLPPSSSSSSSVPCNPPTSSSKPSPSSLKGPPSPSGPSSSSPKPPPTFKPILYPTTSPVINEERKSGYILEKGTSPIFAIPEDIKGQIKKNIVPEILKQPLSPSTYKTYFAALLYAEDFYLEKWSDFLLKNMTLDFHEAAIYKGSTKYKDFSGNLEKDNKIFVAFEIDSVPERRPFLLSRDLVYARPLGKNVEPFQGFIYRVVKSTRVLVEFGDDFHSQHYATRKYDISFSFNRVCLKRAHQAVEAASDPSLQNFLFPEHCVYRKTNLNPPALLHANHELNVKEVSAVRHILSFRGSPPYLLGGSLSSITGVERSRPNSKELSKTGVVVREAIFETYQSSPEHRILICAPINRTCDVLTRSLKKAIPESDMFRANAAFREMDGVPVDILRSCRLKGECFACPSHQELRKFRVILSTFVSSFRLHNEGIASGHFSHIFLVDASLAMEPEVMIPLANFTNENTAVIITGAPKNHSAWVRSDIARKYGLRKSFFDRLHENRLYSSLNPMFITQLVDFLR